MTLKQQGEEDTMPESSSSLFASPLCSDEALKVSSEKLSGLDSPVNTSTLLPQTDLPAEDTKNYQEHQIDQDQDDSYSFPLFFFGSVANLCSATLGAGVLSLPFALLQSGFVGGLVLLSVAAWASVVSIRFLVEASDEYQAYTYEGLVECGLGPKAKRLVELAMIVFCVGCAVAYVMAVGNILEQVAPDLLPRNVSLCIVWATAMLPLSLLRRMESLQFASGVGVASIVTLVVAVLVHFVEDKEHAMTVDRDYTGLLWPASGAMSLIRACPMVIFAFSCQVNVCAIYHELPEPRQATLDNDKPRLMRNVTLTAVLGCSILYGTISTMALLDFGTTVQPNILVNYCPRGMMHVAFGCMALAVVVAFPLNVFPARVAVESMMRKMSTITSNQEGEKDNDLEEPLLLEHEELNHGSQAEDATDEENAECPVVDTLEFVPLDFNLCRHVSLTVGIAGTALALALVVPDISVVFGLLGGTTSSALGFVVPGLLGQCVAKRRGEHSIQARVLIIGGTVVGVLTTLVTVWSTIIQPQSSQPVPDACNVTLAPTISQSLQTIL